MTKEFVICLLLTALCCLPFPVEAQQTRKVPRVGYLVPGGLRRRLACIEAFRQGLRELGYVEGQNIVVE